jgi:hypothetical protein
MSCDRCNALTQVGKDQAEDADDSGEVVSQNTQKERVTSGVAE